MRLCHFFIFLIYLFQCKRRDELTKITKRRLSQFLEKSHFNLFKRNETIISLIDKKQIYFIHYCFQIICAELSKHSLNFVVIQSLDEKFERTF